MYCTALHSSTSNFSLRSKYPTKVLPNISNVSHSYDFFALKFFLHTKYPTKVLQNISDVLQSFEFFCAKFLPAHFSSARFFKCIAQLYILVLFIISRQRRQRKDEWSQIQIKDLISNITIFLNQLVTLSRLTEGIRWVLYVWLCSASVLDYVNQSSLNNLWYPQAIKLERVFHHFKMA